MLLSMEAGSIEAQTKESLGTFLLLHRLVIGYLSHLLQMVLTLFLLSAVAGFIPALTAEQTGNFKLLLHRPATGCLLLLLQMELS